MLKAMNEAANVGLAKMEEEAKILTMDLSGMPLDVLVSERSAMFVVHL
jgi:hypothetical protein